MMNKDMMDMGMDGNTGLENTTWWKPDGTDHFTIREVLISPEGFSVRTTDGRLIGGEIMETYIQSEVPITGHEREQVTPRINAKTLEGIDGAALVDDKPAKKFGSLKYSHPGARFQQPKSQRMIRKEPDPLNDPLDAQPVDEPEDINNELDEVSFGMIDRVMGNVDMNQLTSISINPIEKVDNGIDVLVNTLNIKRKEIRSYLAGRISEKFQEMLDEALDFYLNGLLGPDVDVEDIKAEDIVEED